MLYVLLLLWFFIQSSTATSWHLYTKEYGKQCAEFKPPVSDENLEEFVIVDELETSIKLSIIPKDIENQFKMYYFHYVLYSEYSHSLECPEIEIATNHTILIRRETAHDVEINGLFPSSCYNMFVCTVATVATVAHYTDYLPLKINFKSKTMATYCTKKSTTLITSAYPKIQHYLEEDKNEIVLSVITNCTFSGESTLMLVNIFCNDTWCNQKVESHIWDFKPYSQFRKVLMSYTKYRIQVIFYDKMNAFNYMKRTRHILYDITFRTFQHQSPGVTKLQVTSKTASSVSLRWMPPYPSHGELENYKIRYHIDNYYWIMEWIKPTPCRLWPPFHCVTISINGYLDHYPNNFQNAHGCRCLFLMISGYNKLSRKSTFSTSINITFDEIGKNAFCNNFQSETLNVETFHIKELVPEIVSWLLLLLLLTSLVLILTFRKKLSTLCRKAENPNRQSENQILQTPLQHIMKYTEFPNAESHIYETIDESSLNF